MAERQGETQGGIDGEKEHVSTQGGLTDVGSRRQATVETRFVVAVLIAQERKNACQLKEGPLAYSKQPHLSSGVIQSAIGKGWFSVLRILLQICCGVNQGTAVYRTVRTVVGGQLDD